MTVTVFVGAKGGVGATTIAVDRLKLATRPTTGIDLDLVHGDVAQRFGIQLRTSLADLAAIGSERIAARHVEMLTYRVSERLSIIGSPSHVELAELVFPEHVSDVIANAAKRSDVILDVGSRIDICGLAACRMATEIVMVARDDASCHRQLATLVNLWDRAGINARLSLAMPRARRSRVESVAAILGVDVDRSGNPALSAWKRVSVFAGNLLGMPKTPSSARTAKRPSTWRFDEDGRLQDA